jgi:hypothetical protein
MAYGDGQKLREIAQETALRDVKWCYDVYKQFRDGRVPTADMDVNKALRQLFEAIDRM